MFRTLRASRRLGIAAVALAIGGLALAALAGPGRAASGAVSVACGPATLATISAVDSIVASNIYGGEASGAETQTDLLHITGAAELVSAVAADNRTATLRAVQRIVYHPRWHIVRLRVFDAGGRVLADVGGPYVLAPVTGVLWSGLRVVGNFVMSVQDDLGFAKLEHRFVGDPIGIYVNGKRAIELGGSFPYLAPGGAGVNVDGIHYGAVTRSYHAFPSGTLSAVMAVPIPPASVTAESCAAVLVGETGRVAERIAALFYPLAARYGAFVQVVNADTGATGLVRIGIRPIAGSEGIGPAALPLSGTVSYLGRTWSVFSFAPTPPARIYLLIAQA